MLGSRSLLVTHFKYSSELTCKNRKRLTDLENKLTVAGGKDEGNVFDPFPVPGPSIPESHSVLPCLWAAASESCPRSLAPNGVGLWSGAGRVE